MVRLRRLGVRREARRQHTYRRPSEVHRAVDRVPLNRIWAHPAAKGRKYAKIQAFVSILQSLTFLVAALP
jgi:hypothetical protein